LVTWLIEAVGAVAVTPPDSLSNSDFLAWNHSVTPGMLIYLSLLTCSAVLLAEVASCGFFLPAFYFFWAVLVIPPDAPPAAVGVKMFMPPPRP